MGDLKQKFGLTITAIFFLIFIELAILHFKKGSFFVQDISNHFCRFGSIILLIHRQLTNEDGFEVC